MFLSPEFVFYSKACKLLKVMMNRPASFSHSYGFMLVDALVGVGILALIMGATVSIFRPLRQSFKKNQILTQMHKVENNIRSEIYAQKTYTDLNAIEIKYGNVIVAKNNKTIYVSEDLLESSEDPVFPIAVRLELVPFTQTATGESRVGGLYQVGSSDDAIKINPLGIKSWPEDTTQYLQSKYDPKLNGENAYALLVAPKRFTASQKQFCGTGFLRGVKGDGSGVALCWTLGNTQCGEWSIPIGLKFDSTRSEVSVLCQKFNRVECEPLSLTMNDASQLDLDNFQALSTLNFNDLYPPVSTPKSGLSKCKSIVDFQSYDVAGELPGKISSTVVSDRSPSSVPECPSQRLYTKETDGSCTPKFQMPSVPESSAQVKTAGASP